jgi:hypothetical protein
MSPPVIPGACRLLEEPRQCLEAMLRGRVLALPGHIQAVYTHNILKLMAATLANAQHPEEVVEVRATIAAFAVE